MLPASICHHFLLLGVTLRRNLSHQSSKSWILSLIPAAFLCFRNVAGPLPRLVCDFILQQYEEQASFGVPGTPSGMRGSKAQTSAWYRWHQRASPKHQYLASYLPFCSIYKCATVADFFSLSSVISRMTALEHTAHAGYASSQSPKASSVFAHSYNG